MGGNGSPQKTRRNHRSGTLGGSSEARRSVRRGQAIRFRHSALRRGCAWKFLPHTEADLRGLDDKTLHTYANQIAFYSFPSVRPLPPETRKQDPLRLLERFSPDDLLS